MFRAAASEGRDVVMTERRYESVRKFNRAILNPITKAFAGRWFYALIYHVGRHSGAEYSTPVVASVREEHIYIPLPYGANTDWILNVQAKGQCVVKINNRSYASISPEIVPATKALPVFSHLLQWAFERARIGQFLRLRIE